MQTFETLFISKICDFQTEDQENHSSSTEIYPTSSHELVGTKLIQIYLIKLYLVEANGKPQLYSTFLKKLEQKLMKKFKMDSISFFKRFLYTIIQQKKYDLLDKFEILLQTFLIQIKHQYKPVPIIHQQQKEQNSFIFGNSFSLNDSLNLSKASIQSKQNQPSINKYLEQTQPSYQNRSFNQSKINQYLSQIKNFKTQLNLFCQQMKIPETEWTKESYGKEFKVIGTTTIPIELRSQFKRSQYKQDGNHINSKTASQNVAKKILFKIYTQNSPIWETFKIIKKKKSLQA